MVPLAGSWRQALSTGSSGGIPRRTSKASSLRKVEFETRAVLLRHNLPAGFWGEGVTGLRDTLYELTYLNHLGFTCVERDSFELIETYDYT
jgi:glutamine cyclotransferase